MQGGWSRVLDFGAGPQANLFFTPRNINPNEGPTANMPRFAITNSGFQEEEQLHGKEPFPVGKLTHVVIAIDADKKVGKLYINGKEADSQAMTLTPSAVGSTTNNYLGASEYDTDPMFHGSIAEFRIYDNALTPEEVAASEKAGPDKLADVAAAAAPAAGAKPSAPPAEANEAGKSASASAKGLIHRWSFDKDTTDSIGNSDAILWNDAVVKDGNVSFDGRNQWVDLPIEDSIEKLTSATFEAWFTWDQIQSPWARIFDFGRDQNVYLFFTVRGNRPQPGAIMDTPRFAITKDGWEQEEMLCAGTSRGRQADARRRNN